MIILLRKQFIFNKVVYLFLVRHGHSISNISPKPPETKLTLKGIEQVNSLAKDLNSIKFKKIFYSDYKRTYETFKIIEKDHKKTIAEESSNLREINKVIVGSQKTNSTLSKKDKLTQVKRLNLFLRQINDSFKKKDKVLIITHGNVIRYYIAKCIGIPPNKIWPIGINHASLTIIKLTNKENWLFGINTSVEILKTNEYWSKN